MKELEAFKETKQESVLMSMIDYMNPDEEAMEDMEGEAEYDVGYTQKDIDECGAILDDYIDDLIKSDKNEKLIITSVQKVVLALNALNEKCEGGLIETDQREDLCPFIQESALIAGLTATDEDITYEWREW